MNNEVKDIIIGIAIAISITLILVNLIFEIQNRRNWLNCMRGEDKYEDFDCHICDKLYNKEGKYQY